MVCDVTNCVADAVEGLRFCRQHLGARTAKELRLGPDNNGLGAVRCGKCRRAFKDDDYVERESRLVKSRKGPVSKWQRVACEPKSARPTRKQIRESVKSLLSAAPE